MEHPVQPRERSEERLSTREYSGVLTWLGFSAIIHTALCAVLIHATSTDANSTFSPRCHDSSTCQRGAIRRVLPSTLQGVSTARYSPVLYSVAAGMRARIRVQTEASMYAMAQMAQTACAGTPSVLEFPQGTP